MGSRVAEYQAGATEAMTTTSSAVMANAARNRHGGVASNHIAVMPTEAATPVRAPRQPTITDRHTAMVTIWTRLAPRARWSPAKRRLERAAENSARASMVPALSLIHI
mgnify:CR=1 FL=1